MPGQERHSSSVAADRQLLRSMFDAAVEAARPWNHMSKFLPDPPAGRTMVIGAGKAASQMAAAVERAWNGPLDGLVITGPATVSGAERAVIVSELLDKPVAYAVVTEEQLRAGLNQANLPAAIVEAFVEIKHTFIDGKFDIVTGDIERLSGRPPKPLRDVLAQHLI